MGDTFLEPRRGFLHRWLGALAAVPLAGSAIALLVRGDDGASTPGPVAIPAETPVGLSIVGHAIVHRRTDGSVTAFSSRCTHMGCRIDRVSGNEAVCPCHGSRYGADGAVISGPAARPLAVLRVEPDATSGGWTAHAS